MFNITTAISYTNGNPHIGHALEFVLADFLARFNRMRGLDVEFLTGTDEHGEKIQRSADALGIKPIQLCDRYVAEFKRLDSVLGISYDTFIRTTDLSHISRVRSFMEECSDDVYLGSYDGWYDVKEESFISDRDAEKDGFVNPSTNEPYQRLSEPSYFFKLSRYQDQIVDHIKSNASFIIPSTRRDEILNRLSEPLRDLSITRTSIEWGIKLESDPSHVLYVWFDALVNYMAIGTASVHVIGKDILWFHAVIWVGMLISAGRAIPTQIYSHNFVNDSDGRKMSKSVGNVVDPFQLCERIPVSVLRFYLVRETTLHGDISLNLSELEAVNDKILLPQLGNLVNRVFGLARKYTDSKIPNSVSDQPFDLVAFNAVQVACIGRYQFRSYIENLMDVLAALNKYVTDTHIWEKTTSEVSRARSIRTMLEGLWIVGHYVYPVMPNTGDAMFKYFNRPRMYFHDLSWVSLLPGSSITASPALLYTIIDVSTFEKKKLKNMK